MVGGKSCDRISRVRRSVSLDFLVMGILLRVLERMSSPLEEKVQVGF